MQPRTGDLGSSHGVASSHYIGAQPCGFSNDSENGLSDTQQKSFSVLEHWTPVQKPTSAMLMEPAASVL